MLLCFALTLILWSRPLWAHSPHDTIDAIDLSPAYGSDRTLFIGITSHLLRSRDGGETWAKLVQGLDNEFNYSSIAVSPRFDRDATLLVGTRGDGVYRSLDGGESWVAFNDGLTHRAVKELRAVGGDASTTRYLALMEDGVVYRTRDAEGGWRAVWGDEPIAAIASGTGPVWAAGHSGALFRLQPSEGRWEAAPSFAPLPGVTALHVVAGRLFVGTEDGGLHSGAAKSDAAIEKLETFNGPVTSIDSRRREGGGLELYVTTWEEAVFVSRDAGASWSRVGDGLTTDKQANSSKYRSPQFRAVAVARDEGETIDRFVAGFDGLFKLDGGASAWRQLETRPVGNIKGLTVAETADGRPALFVATYGGGIYASDDGGSSWRVGNYGVRTTRFSDIAVSPHYGTDRTVFSGVYGNLTRSRDGGRHWETINHKESYFFRRAVRKVLRVMGFEKTAGRILTRHALHPPYPHALAISPDFARDRTLFIGTRWHGLLKSEDAGESSEVVLSTEKAEHAVTNIRLSPDFADDGTLFASIRNVGLHRSTDGGETWSLLDTATTLTRGWDSAGGHADTLAYDVHVDLSRNFARDKTLLAGTQAGLFRSTDGGDGWAGLDVDPAVEREIVLEIRSAAEGVWYVSLKGHGLYRSDDGGHSFVRVNTDLMRENQEIEYIEVSPGFRKYGRLYAASDTTLFELDGESARAISRPVRYEDTREQPVKFVGSWKREEGAAFSGWSETETTDPDDYVELGFTGESVALHGTHGKDGGDLEVYIDGELRMRASQYAEEETPGVETFSITGLEEGRHTVRVVVVAKHNPRNKVSVDYFDILGGDISGVQ